MSLRISKRKTRRVLQTESPVVSLAVRQAKRYIDAGYSVIPLAPRGKTPINRGGLSNPITKWDAFLPFATDTPTLNYGVVTGSGSNLIVLDIDGDVGGASFATLTSRHEPLPPTVMVQTGKGRHIYFYSENDEIRGSAGRLGANIDVRANGGYIVGVGSIHENGTQYTYFPDHGSDLGLADLPQWLENLLLPTKPLPVASATSLTHAALLFEGQRNAALASVAGKLVNTGISPEAVFEALKAENEKLCKPPLDDGEVLKISESVCHYPARDPNEDEAESLMKKVLAEHFSGGQRLLFARDGHFWWFAKTHWQILSIYSLQQKILRTIESLSGRKGANTSSLMTQTTSLLRARCAENGDPLRFSTDLPLVINCRNAELWLAADGSIDRRPHNPLSYLRHCFPIDYDPSSRCPRYDKAIGEIFSKAKEPLQLSLFWDELAGYVMQPSRQKALIIIGTGGGSNGKTELLQLLIKMIGENLVIARPIQDLEKSAFAIAALDGKLLLLDDDVKAGTRLPDGQLKTVSEAKIITGEHKFQSPFSFTVRTVPVMLCNGQPSIADLSYGLRRRLQVVPFERRFHEHEQDTYLFPRIIADELSGVLNRYLAGLQRLMAANWCFDPPEDVRKATDDFVIGANPLPAFIKEACEKTGSSWVRDLFQDYQNWCTISGITHKQQRSTFGRNLISMGFEVKHGNQGDKVCGLQKRSSDSG